MSSNLNVNLILLIELLLWRFIGNIYVMIVTNPILLINIETRLLHNILIINLTIVYTLEGLVTILILWHSIHSFVHAYLLKSMTFITTIIFISLVCLILKLALFLL